MPVDWGRSAHWIVLMVVIVLVVFFALVELRSVLGSMGLLPLWRRA